MPEVTQGQSWPRTLGALAPRPVDSLPVSLLSGRGQGPPAPCRCLTHDLADVRGPVTAPERDRGLLHHRQMLLYSQELEDDYTPCEEDLFVL